MAQLFHPTSNVISKLTIVAVLLAVPLLGAAAYSINMIYGYKYFVPVEQPVQFSHRHHVGDDGIDCRYCHTSVEKAATAGMPPTHTCMTCHSQIWSDSPELQAVRASYTSGQPIRWNRVHDMPDFVYFNHSIHVRKGVSCETCHGRVDEKQLMFKSHTMTMSWCLDCHRNPEKFIRPRETVFAMGWKLNQSEGEAAPSMATAPATLAETRSGILRAKQGQATNDGHDPAITRDGLEQAHEDKEHAAATTPEMTPQQREAAARRGDYSGFKTQIELGQFLKKEYNVRSARELTDCYACHR
jgi:hypothetical protein